MKGKPLVSIVSAGLSKFGKLEGLYAREIFAEAAKEAFDRCPNLNPKKDIQALFIGHMGESYEHQGHTGATMAEWAGLLHVPATRTEAACASSGAALRAAIYAVLSGLADVVMVGGVEKMTHRSTAEVTEYLAMASDYPFEQWHGITFPGLYALMATAHMHKYGTTEKQLAAVAVKNHYHGSLNPKAHMQKEITPENALSSRVIAWPLKLYDCSLITDGASCLILTKPELAKKYTDTPVHIIGSGQASDTIGLYERESFTSLAAARLAAKKAYEMADVKPENIDVAEVHDCFTIAEIIAYEDLGFCKPGGGGQLAEKGETKLGGRIPVNTSGGLKAKGHPVGATGTGQAYEIFLQLTRQADKRQVKNAEIGLTHNVGGSGATATVHIYRRG
ncbi:MAG: thiolase domain-containing protein [Candidatus Bathyarchaeota archaeon]|nr:thiolase domain-containing protein [Candidatus Bathyarchaeota archaeon A05DMB-5]MDH7558364.1 thiolase domain-containing protein [Candidatus Bathyarchaeota archaeon]